MPRSIQTQSGEYKQVKDLRKSKFVWMDKDVITSLNSWETRVYLILDYYRNEGRGDAYPSFSTMCKKAKCSRSTVRRCIKSLIKKGIIHVEKRNNTKKGHISNIYYLLK